MSQRETEKEKQKERKQNHVGGICFLLRYQVQFPLLATPGPGYLTPTHKECETAIGGTVGISTRCVHDDRRHPALKNKTFIMAPFVSM